MHRPARDFEPYIRALCATANARDLGDLTGPRALLYIAMLVHEFPQHSRAAGRTLNLAAAPLATLARAVGLTTRARLAVVTPTFPRSPEALARRAPKRSISAADATCGVHRFVEMRPRRAD